MLREGLGDRDRRSGSSAVASLMGILGIICIPLVSGFAILAIFRRAIVAGEAAAVMGMVAGLATAVGILGRQALLPKRPKGRISGPGL